MRTLASHHSVLSCYVVSLQPVYGCWFVVHIAVQTVCVQTCYKLIESPVPFLCISGVGGGSRLGLVPVTINDLIRSHDNRSFSALLHTIYYMFLSPPRPLVVKPSVLQLQQFGIPSHSVSGNHHLLAPSNVISKLIYLPSSASPFSHSATPAPLTRACLNLCAIQIL